MEITSLEHNLVILTKPTSFPNLDEERYADLGMELNRVMNLCLEHGLDEKLGAFLLLVDTLEYVPFGPLGVEEASKGRTGEEGGLRIARSFIGLLDLENLGIEPSPEIWSYFDTCVNFFQDTTSVFGLVASVRLIYEDMRRKGKVSPKAFYEATAFLSEDDPEMDLRAHHEFDLSPLSEKEREYVKNVCKI